MREMCFEQFTDKSTMYKKKKRKEKKEKEMIKHDRQSIDS